jgi:hypothetical protein
MIEQGTNIPIEITFDMDVADLPKLIVTIWRGSSCLKAWTKDDMQIDGRKVLLPLTEEETANFPTLGIRLEAKALNDMDQTLFWEAVNLTVGERRDREIELTEES